MEDEIKYVKSSTYRYKALKSLAESPKIPKQIAEDIGIMSNHISNTLRQLVEHDLVICINPEMRKGKIYKLTDKGEEIIKKIV